MKLYKVRNSKHFIGEAIYFNPYEKRGEGKYLFLDKIKFDETGNNCLVESVFYNQYLGEWVKDKSRMDANIVRWMLAYDAGNLSTYATIHKLNKVLKEMNIQRKK